MSTDTNTNTVDTNPGGGGDGGIKLHLEVTFRFCAGGDAEKLKRECRYIMDGEQRGWGQEEFIGICFEAAVNNKPAYKVCAKMRIYCICLMSHLMHE